MQQMAAKSVTVYDIAQAAETSVSTVSRVLNRSSLIGEQTREHVLTVARSLGYSQRQIRRPGGRSILNVVVFLPNKAQPEYHLFYDAAELLGGVYEGLGDRRAHTIAALNHSLSPFAGKKLGDIDGCIFAFCEPDEKTMQALSSRDIPFILINRRSDYGAGVINDAQSGFCELGNWIAQKRPSARALFVATDEQQPVAGYRLSALRSSGVALLEHAPSLHLPTIAALCTDRMQESLREGFDLFVCVNDLVAVAVTERLLRLGRRIPETAGVTGYDNAPVRSLLETPIATVDLAVSRLACRAAERLVEAILSREALNGIESLAGSLVPEQSV